MLSLITKAASTSKYDKLIVLVAYATKLGCETLIASLIDSCQNWDMIDKKWIISLDFGHTQPEALELLAKLPNSAVAIPNADLVLNSKLNPPIRFHPKLFYFQSTSDPQKAAIVSGSCNLTFGGLYMNTEQATITVLQSTSAKLSKQEIAQLIATQNIINDIWSTASPLTKKIMNKYRSLWKPRQLPSTEKKPSSKFISTNPSIDRVKALALSSATNFWIRVTPKVVQNLGPGKPGNQIDMQHGARVFFDFDVANVPPNTGLGSVPISFKGIKSKRSLRYGNNGMDKITLPVLQSPQTYANRTLLFHRNPKGYFELVIGTPKKIAQWRERSLQQNTLYQMQSGREFGVFD